VDLSPSGQGRVQCGCRAKTPRRADRDRLPSGPARREAHEAARHLASRAPVPRRDTRAFRGTRVERLALRGHSAVGSRASSTKCADSPSDLGHVVAFDDGRPGAGMDRLPNRQIDIDNPPRLGRIGRPRDGHVKTLTARVGGDEAERLQKFLQVADKAWSIDDDVQAAVTLRSCRNGVAFSHCREKTDPVKGRTGSSVAWPSARWAQGGREGRLRFAFSVELSRRLRRPLSREVTPATMRIPRSRAAVNGPCRDRTCDLGIKSPLLYQLS
jgi:hypothetical protein